MNSRLFAGLADSTPDPILTLMDVFRRDPRTEKMDLGVGMYRDAAGNTPVMAAIKAAERKLWETQETKGYVGLPGDPGFHRAVAELALGPFADWDRLAMIATPGGTGAVRQGFEFLRQVRPESRLWLPDPTWPNHTAIADMIGLPRVSYGYAAAGAQQVDETRMLEDLGGCAAGDVILLHACCHNPTGLDISPAAWDAVRDICAARGAVPFVDMAYQGFGQGLEADAAGLRKLAKDLPEFLLSFSASKTFGLYRERAGLLVVQTSQSGERSRVQASLDALNRLTYSFPPDHGARSAQMVLDDPDLRALWMAELEEMRQRLAGIRRNLAQELNNAGIAKGIGLDEGQGLFARLPLSGDAIAWLRREHGFYLVQDGRMNVAGIAEDGIARLAGALATALQI